MTSAQRFCPTCGAPTPEDPVDKRGRCRTCYLEEHELLQVPEDLTVDRCGSCGSLELDGEWTDIETGLAEQAIDLVADRVAVIESVDELEWEVKTDAIDDRTIEVTALFDLHLDGGWERRERTTRVTFEPTVCQRCSRIAGDDFGAIVQLRATDRTPDEAEISRAREVAASVLEDRVDAGDRDAFLTDVVERPEGVDLRLSTPRLGNQLATAIRRALGGTLDTSRTLVTTDGDGREVYRVTYTLRFGQFRRGDILTTDDGALLVEGGTEGVHVLDLSTGERRTVTASDLEAARVTTLADAEQVTVVSVLDDRAVQVIHPTSYEAVTVAYYGDIDLDQETVRAVEVQDQLYLLPDDV